MKRNLQRIKNVLKDPNKKPLTTMVKDVLQLWYLKKHFPLYYFGRFFYRKEAQDPKQFMSLKEYNTIVKRMVLENEKTPELSLLLDDKLEFYKHCKAHGIPTAEVIGYNHKTVFNYDNKTFEISAPEALERFIVDTCNKHKLSTLFFKPFDKNSGKGILKIDKNQFDINRLWDLISTTNYIHQKTVEQHPEINKIYAKSANTVRLETFVDKHGGFNLLGRYMRFGAGGSYVDNVNQGGLYVSINLDTGTLVKYAETNSIFGAKQVDRHPDTGTVFENFKIPYFQEALALVKKATFSIPTYIQAWDVIITPDGPILLEGNNYPSMITGEYSYGGYKNKREVFKELLATR